MRKTVIILSVLALISSCTTRWTEKQKRAFAENCSKTDTIDGLTFSLTGFTYDEIKNVMIKQIHNGQVVDSFYIQANKNIYDSLRTRYIASIDKPLYIKDTFQFEIHGQAPYILSDMKMIMWAQFTMFSEGYGCIMGDYKINGVRFEHSANPDFIKKGFKYPWEK
jgi:hypothetical protein